MLFILQPQLLVKSSIRLFGFVSTLRLVVNLVQGFAGSNPLDHSIITPVAGIARPRVCRPDPEVLTSPVRPRQAPPVILDHEPREGRNIASPKHKSSFFSKAFSKFNSLIIDFMI